LERKRKKKSTMIKSTMIKRKGNKLVRLSGIGGRLPDNRLFEISLENMRKLSIK